MDAQRQSEITGWEAREFSGGFSGLRPLADRGFSGAVTDGMGWLFLFEGRVVGAVDTDLDAFADASGTVYEAPHESLPVLFAMQEQGGEPRAQYYTNDTPLSEADRKLTQGGFTGYIELSENVLSGDYYVAYAAGESMTAAYVGNSRRLETGDDAFRLADDEVGIYTVYEVDLNVREIPNGGNGATDRSAGSTPTDRSAGSTSTDRSEESAATGETDPEIEAGSADETDGSSDEPVKADEAVAASGSNGGSDSRDADARDDGTDHPSDPSPGDDAIEAEAERSDAAGRDQTARSTGQSPRPGTEPAHQDPQQPATDDGGDDGRRPEDDVFSEEEQWREQKSIPALDPSKSSDPSDRGSESNGSRGSTSESNRNRGSTSGSGGPSARPPQQDGHQAETDPNGSTDPGRSPDPRPTVPHAENRSAVSQRAGATEQPDRSERIEELETALEAARSERESVATERDELAADVDRLEAELSDLREERDRLREELSNARDRLPDGERSLSPTEARSGTNLFVRYGSKGGATLEDVHDGDVDREMLRENLRIEHHTSFETEGLVVDGRPYDEFLTDSIEYGFTRWLVEDLPFEVSGTGNQSVLRDLYDALPEIDRAEIGGSVSVAIRENGEETREQRAFDLVLRDRMGNPLFVADLNDSRDPTAEGTLESLVGNGRDIAESNDSFAGAFAVTESFFEPGALETASDAVGGGLFSRSKRASFVKLSRKRGFHLCLVEARDGGFHMTVPDL